MTDRIFYHIGPLFTLSPTWQPRKSKFWNNLKTPGDIIILTHKHHIWKSYVWSLRYGARWTKCFVIWDCFFPFTPLMTQKFKILKKWKTKTKTKTRRHYNFTNVHHKWQSYDKWFLRYGVWQPDFLSFWTICLPFYTPNTKNQNFEKNEKKNSWTHHHLTQVYQKSWSYNTLFLRYDAWQYFCPFTPLTTQKIKIFKKWKNILGMSSFYTHIPKIMITHCTVLEIWCATNRLTGQRTNKRTNGQKEKVTEVDAPPKK